MSLEPIYEEVTRVLGPPGRAARRRSDGFDGPARSARPVMLRGSGGRHRRPGE